MFTDEHTTNRTGTSAEREAEMITVTVLQQKGGSGKTTLMQMLATAMLDRKGRVHMMDVDSDQQLLEWKAKSDSADWDGLDRVEWPPGLTMGTAPKNVEELYDTLNRLEEQGIDLVLIDTRPGAYADTEDLALAADVILVPAPPLPAAFALAEKSLRWVEAIIGTVSDGEPTPIYRTVMMDAPLKAIELATAPTDEARERILKKVHAQDREVFEFVQRLPMLPTPVKHSDIIRRMPVSGPLTLVRDTYRQDIKKSLSANHTQTQIDVCNELLNDVIDALEEGHA